MKLAKWWRGNQESNRGSARSQMLHDPYYRLRPEEIPIAAKLGIKIDVNQAGVDDWLRLPGLSIHQARSLVALRQSGVAFHCLEDIAAALGVPIHRLQGLVPVLQFCYYGSAGELAPPINPNTASVERLIQIPAIDLFLARAIVQNRQQGAYKNLADLQRRLALPGSLTAEIMHYLQF
ncbi:MAG: ComEA family DNA-binding protein [Leptolyngbyaceae cyanobacterium CSU_1_4]|nr:ComEA family DNA-binding protein [Leptolyngbyaceae cyanobacterium CSU_1_4]